MRNTIKAVVGSMLLIAGAMVPAMAQTAPAEQTPAAPAAAPAPAAPAVPAVQPFTVTLPTGFGAYATQASTAKTADGGSIETTNWVTKSITGEAVVVTVSKMPKKILDPAKFIGGTRDSLLKALKATLESEEKVEGTDATRLMFNNGAKYLRARLQVEGDTLYQLLYVGGSAEQRGSESVGQMFDSFKIAAPAAAATATAAKQ